MVDIDYEERLRRDMAAALDCFTESEVQTLARYADSTLENLRRRHQGPDYIVFGKTILYPRARLRDYLTERVRDRSSQGGGTARSLL